MLKQFSFQPKQTTKSLLSHLDKKPRDILEQRFGLCSSGNPPKTLEAIGQGYGITRERVRQIEEDALARLRKSDGFSNLGNVFNELKNKIDLLGGLVHEKEFLNLFSGDTPVKYHIRFLLVLGDDFKHLKEDDDFHHRWTIDQKRAEGIHESFRKLHRELSPDDLLTEKEMFSRFVSHIKNTAGVNIDKDIIPPLIKISRLIDSNALGEWGHISSPAIRPRGVRDLAYLTMRRHGSPMHFRETAEAVSKIFSRPVNAQTVHNELIKDNRFVLVGRGLYALKEWGYESGIVRDVIRKVLLSNGPLSKEEIVKIVMKERYVKENTILINLQNSKYFKKNSSGAYIAIS
jgi:hypothetical protein